MGSPEGKALANRQMSNVSCQTLFIRRVKANLVDSFTSVVSPRRKEPLSSPRPRGYGDGGSGSPRELVEIYPLPSVDPIAHGERGAKVSRKCQAQDRMEREEEKGKCEQHHHRYD